MPSLHIITFPQGYVGALRESSFNMTSGGGGDEDIEGGGPQKFLDTRKGGGSKNLYT